MNHKKKKHAWQTFLSFFILLLAVISIYFLFRHFKNKPQKNNAKKLPVDTKNRENNNSLLKSKSWKQGIDYRPIQPTQDEPEYQGKLLSISSVGTEYKRTAVEFNMLPRGSAILTSSGDLEKQGIKAIVHACPGSMEKKSKDFQPNIQGIIKSVQNSIILVERHDYKSVAFCLIGSNSLDSIIPPNRGTKKERQAELAETIIKVATEKSKKLERIVFVDFGNQAFGEAWSKVNPKLSGRLKKTFTVKGWKRHDYLTGKKRGIDDYSFHKCEVIVNSLNIEGEFINSGSFSGFIAGKTGSKKIKIQNDIKEYITEFNERLKKQY